jgi:NADPH oxidase
MELRIIKPSFKYTAGQWLFIQVPEISRWQWHPVRRSCLSCEIDLNINNIPTVYHYIRA